MDSVRFRQVMEAVQKAMKADKMDHPSYQHVLLMPMEKKMGESVFGPVIQKVLQVSYTSINQYRLSFDLPIDRDLGIETPVFAHIADICTFLSKAKPKQGEVIHVETRERTEKGMAGVEDTVTYLGLGYRQESAGKNRLEIEISCADMDQKPPALPDLGLDLSEIEVNTAYFTQNLSRAKVMVSLDDVRVNLCRVCMYSSGQTVTLASTDGHRLYKSTCEMVESGTLKTATRVDDAILLPPEVVKILLSELDPKSSFRFAVTPKSFYRVTQGDMLLESTEDCNATFPDFSMVIPSVKSDHIIFDLPVTDSVECCDLIKTFPDAEKLMHLTMRGQGTELTASGAKIQQQMVIKRVQSDLNFVFRVNAVYFKDALTTLIPDGAKKGKSVRLHFWDNLSPIIVNGEGLDPKMLAEFVLVMPMRM